MNKKELRGIIQTLVQESLNKKGPEPEWFSVGGKRNLKLVLSKAQFDVVKNNFSEFKKGKAEGITIGKTIDLKISTRNYKLFVEQDKQMYNVYGVSKEYTIGKCPAAFDLKYNTYKDTKKIFDSFLTLY